MGPNRNHPGRHSQQKSEEIFSSILEVLTQRRTDLERGVCKEHKASMTIREIHNCSEVSCSYNNSKYYIHRLKELGLVYPTPNGVIRTNYLLGVEREEAYLTWDCKENTINGGRGATWVIKLATLFHKLGWIKEWNEDPDWRSLWDNDIAELEKVSMLELTGDVYLSRRNLIFAELEIAQHYIQCARLDMSVFTSEFKEDSHYSDWIKEDIQEFELIVDKIYGEWCQDEEEVLVMAKKLVEAKNENTLSKP